MLQDEEPKPCQQIHIKNVEDIIKRISGFIQYWEHLREAVVGGSFCHQYETWIGYWTHVHSTLTNLHPDSPPYN